MNPQTPSTPSLPNIIVEPDWKWITPEVVSWRDRFIALAKASPNAKPNDLWQPCSPFNLARFHGFGRFLAWAEQDEI